MSDTDSTASSKRCRAILLAEDEALLRLVAADTLRDAGFDVIEARDGVEALEALRARDDIALLITDIKMPRLDGYQLASEALTLKPGLKIVLTTGYARDPMPLNISRLTVLSKPFDFDRLVALANELLADD